jgi:gas vesicle protein
MMTFSERMMELMEQGMAASKEFAIKAGVKAQDLGERGILMVEVKQLETKAEKQLSRLGNEIYRAFAERKQSSVDRNAPEIETIMAELAKLRDAIEQKETELRSRRT